MTQPQADPNRALASAIAEGISQALGPQLIPITTVMRQRNELLAELVHAVDRVAELLALQISGEQDPDEAPDIEMPLDRFAAFDWSTIGAQVLQQDEYGAAIVSYRGKAYKRRSPDNAYNPAVWFSRAVGKDDEGKNRYVRLITFKPMNDDVQPMGRKAERAVAATPAAQPARQAAQSAAQPPAQSAAPHAPVALPPRAAPPAKSSAPQAQPPAAATPALPASQGQQPHPEQHAQPTADRPATAQPGLDEPGWLADGTTSDELFDQMRSASAGRRQTETTQSTGRSDEPTGIRAATIGAGDTYRLFGQWAAEFVRRYPYYAQGDRPNYPKLLQSITGVGRKAEKNFGHITLENLADIQNEMEAHAAANHSGGKA